MFHPEYINPKKLINNEDILQLFKIIENHGGALRFVGGAVRDAIAGFKRADIDLVTDLSPSEFSDICVDEGLKCVPIGIQFFTLGVIVNNSFFKVTCLSTEEDITQEEWKKDAARRDLTINAVYADDKGNVFDYYNGIEDLENGVIKFIGRPIKTIEDDPIRIMRFFRFCAMFGKKIDRKSLKCCIENKHLLQKVSQEKIKEELFKIILAPYAARALELVFKYGVLDFLIAPPSNIKNIELLDKIVSALNIEKSVIRRIFVLFEPTAKRAERLSKIFKLTREQKEYFITLCNAKLSAKNFKDTVSINKAIYTYGKDVCKDICIYLNLNNPNIDEIRDILHTLDSTKVPAFPLKGKDILDLGVNEKFLSLYMDVLKKEWFEHGCSYTKEELLEQFKIIFKYGV